MLSSQVYKIVKNDEACKLIFKKKNIFRFVPFGESFKDIEKAYAVWQSLSAAPYQVLDNQVKLENHLIQVDIYSDSRNSTEEAYKVLIKAFEKAGCIVQSYRDTIKEDIYYRASLDVMLILHRNF